MGEQPHSQRELRCKAGVAADWLLNHVRPKPTARSGLCFTEFVGRSYRKGFRLVVEAAVA